ncbi:MAG: histidinol-phosphatase HisJ family protein [Ruminococcus sp.]|nr:histidinol-phosphatase HisJ family protein [Ruminococcus sp.]
MLRMDLHTHTHHSPDAADTVAERIARGAELGLQIMAVTDHCEVNHFYPAAYYGEAPCEEIFHNGRQIFFGSVTETAEAQKNNPPLLLLCGAELGQIPQCPGIAKQLYNDPRLDVVIGSVHELPGLPDFYFLDYENYDTEKLLDQYFREVLAVACSDAYDILGHLTYALRYLPDREGYDLTPHLPVIDAIFHKLMEKDKALELNGSGLKAGSPYTDPDLCLLRRYFSLGGRRLSLSTDAHSTAYLAYRMDEIEQMAREIGFTELTCFRKHQPVSIPL